MQSDFIELVKIVGTIALLLVVVIVLVIIVISIVDRHPRQESGSKKNDDAKPMKK